MPPLALLLLAAQTGGIASGGVPPRGTLYTHCAGVRVGAPDRAIRPKDTTFSSRETLDLALHPRVRQNLPGEHLLQLKIFTPGGFLYQVISLRFVGDDRSDGRERGWITNRPAAGTDEAPPPRVVPGSARPLQVQRLVPVRGGAGRLGEYELSARLPVAGTSITLSSLYGTWSLQPYLDGRTEPCGPATTFTIRE
jgi:hypothetical protein